MKLWSWKFKESRPYYAENTFTYLRRKPAEFIELAMFRQLKFIVVLIDHCFVRKIFSRSCFRFF